MNKKNKKTIKMKPNTIVELNFGYREDLIIEKEGNDIVINRTYCVPDREGDVGFDFEELARFKI